MENETQARQGLIQKYPQLTLPVYMIIGAIIIWFGFVMRNDIIDAEINGGTITLPRILFPVYETIGANGILWITILFGIYVFYKGFTEHKKLSRNTESK